MPSALLVILSWIGPWVDKSVTGSRVSIGLLTVLTVVTQVSNTSPFTLSMFVLKFNIVQFIMQTQNSSCEKRLFYIFYYKTYNCWTDPLFKTQCDI